MYHVSVIYSTINNLYDFHFKKTYGEHKWLNQSQCWSRKAITVKWVRDDPPPLMWKSLVSKVVTLEQ